MTNGYNYVIFKYRQDTLRKYKKGVIQMLRSPSSGTPRWQHNFSLNQAEQDLVQKALSKSKEKDKYFSLKDLLMVGVDKVLEG